jgi:hypothetical protein
LGPNDPRKAGVKYIEVTKAEFNKRHDWRHNSPEYTIYEIINSKRTEMNRFKPGRILDPF